MNSGDMERDTLFLLKYGFEDGPASSFYCPECSEVNGLLHAHPQLRHQLDVHYLNFARPLLAIVNRIGEDNQSCPVLVLTATSPSVGTDVTVAQIRGDRFISGARAIGLYWALRFGTSRPH